MRKTYSLAYNEMKYYSFLGVNDFILCLGYLRSRSKTKEYFVHFEEWQSSDFMLKFGRGEKEVKILNEVNIEIKNQYLSCEKDEKLLGWKAKFNLKDALIESYKWYKSFFKENN